MQSPDKLLTPREAVIKYATFGYKQAVIQRWLLRIINIGGFMGVVVGKLYQPWPNETLYSFIIVMLVASVCAFFANKLVKEGYQQAVQRARAAGEDVLDPRLHH